MKNIRKRKRGAPKGNLNALKHGFYSRQFRLGEGVDLERISGPGLDNEIEMLRVATRRMFDMAGVVGEPHEMAWILRTLGMTSVQLASLLRTKKALEGGSNEVEEALKQALSELQQEWNLR